MAHKAISVANEFLSLAEKYRIEKNKPYWFINALELHKLVVIAHGVHFYFEQKALVSDKLIVGEFEPTFDELSESLAFYGDDPVTRYIPEDGSSYDAFFSESVEFKPTILTAEENTSVEATWNLFSEYGLTCGQLAYFTRGEQENWEEERVKLQGVSGNIYPVKLLAERIENLFSGKVDQSAA